MHSKVWDEITYPFLNFNDCFIAKEAILGDMV